MSDQPVDVQDQPHLPANQPPSPMGVLVGRIAVAWGLCLLAIAACLFATALSSPSGPLKVVWVVALGTVLWVLVMAGKNANWALMPAHLGVAMTLTAKSRQIERFSLVSIPNPVDRLPETSRLRMAALAADFEASGFRLVDSIGLIGMQWWRGDVPTLSTLGNCFVHDQSGLSALTLTTIDERTPQQVFPVVVRLLELNADGHAVGVICPPTPRRFPDAAEWSRMFTMPADTPLSDIFAFHRALIAKERITPGPVAERNWAEYFTDIDRKLDQPSIRRGWLVPAEEDGVLKVAKRMWLGASLRLVPSFEMRFIRRRLAETQRVRRELGLAAEGR